MKKSKGQDHVIIINISLQRFTKLLQCDITTEILHITQKNENIILLEQKDFALILSAIYFML